ncbi:hypothetical protein AGMMS49921_13630 [Endomicrobiia bacterium]|nr:hypothetical protein AGMMS49921_13630 [Endomicrobiia bacterium]
MGFKANVGGDHDIIEGEGVDDTVGESSECTYFSALGTCVTYLHPLFYTLGMK